MKTLTHEKWWYNTGSSIRPKKNEDYEEFAERITKIAFEAALCNQWIYSKDKLPDKNGLYLCLTWGQTPKVCLYNADKQEWWRQTASKRITGIQYWMKIPKLKM